MSQYKYEQSFVDQFSQTEDECQLLDRDFGLDGALPTLEEFEQELDLLFPSEE